MHSIGQISTPAAARQVAANKKVMLRIIAMTVFVVLVLSWYGIGAVSRIHESEKQWIEYTEYAAKVSFALNEVKSNFGYGGFIHNFKNYVLRKDTSRIPLIEQNLSDTQAAISRYAELDISAEERIELYKLKLAVSEYHEKFHLAKELINKGLSSQEIDELVRVDDKPAIKALKKLATIRLQASQQEDTQTREALTQTIEYMSWGILLLPLIFIVSGTMIWFTGRITQTNNELSRATQYASDLFEAAPDAVLVINDEGKIVKANVQAEKLLGYQREEFTSLKVEDLVPASFRSEHRHIRQDAFSDAKARPLSSEVEFSAITKSGEAVPVDITLSYSLQPEGKLAIATVRDVSERRKAEHDLKYNQLMLNKAQEISRVGSWDWNLKSNKLEWSDEVYRILGYEPQELKADYDTFLARLHPEDRESVVNAVNEALIMGKKYDIEHRVVRPDGVERTVHEQGEVLHGNDSKPLRMIGTVQDITELKKSQFDLRLADNVFKNSMEAILVSDKDNRILRVNGAFIGITGFMPADVIGKRPQEVLSSGKHDKEFYKQLWATLLSTGYWEGEIWDRRKSGEIFPARHNISVVKNENDEIVQHISIFNDITHEKRAKERIETLAHYDQLTRLPNRMLFNDRLEHAIQRATRDPHQVGLMFIDLDRFKNVNDTLGHHAGDRLLQIVAERLKECVREEDTVARLGGDEFTIILEKLTNAEDAAVVADKILKSITKKMNLDGHDVVVGGSIGVSVFPDDGDDAESILKNADIAMYRAKEQGRNQYQFYTSALAKAAEGRFHIERELHAALENQELVLHYQPQVNAAQGRMTGMEALLRWHHPDKGVIPPLDFIPLAEETGLILPISNWVLLTACRQARNWHDVYKEPFKMAVNVSAYQMTHGDIVAEVDKALTDTGLSAQYLELEITESFLMENPQEGLAKLSQLRRMGVTLAIDDFGTGYSSLSYLKNLDVDRFKIDRSFVMDVPGKGDDEAIVETIVAMSKTLGLKVIAEGVEQQEQVEFLFKRGCADIQGYYYSKPLTANELEKLFGRQWQPCIKDSKAG